MLLVSSSAVRQEMNVFPLSSANPCRCFFLLTICMQLSMWINGDWRVVESGWCQVINQHNECRWAWCRWSPHSWLCHSAGSLRFPLLPFNVWLHVSTKLSLPRSIPWLILAIFFFFLFYPVDIFTQLKRKKRCAGAISLQLHSLNLDVTWQTRAVHQTLERLCFLLHGRQMPPSQLCCTGKLATFKKHNHLRTCNKCREMGKWPYCQLAKDKWRAQICEFTGFLRIEGWFIINTCFCLSLQSFDGASIDMNMDTDYYRQKFMTTRCVKQYWLLKRHPLVGPLNLCC